MAKTKRAQEQRPPEVPWMEMSKEQQQEWVRDRRGTAISFILRDELDQLRAAYPSTLRPEDVEWIQGEIVKLVAKDGKPGIKVQVAPDQHLHESVKKRLGEQHVMDVMLDEIGEVERTGLRWLDDRV